MLNSLRFILKTVPEILVLEKVIKIYKNILAHKLAVEI